MCTRQGPRPAQEDRFAVLPNLLGRGDCLFACVFDGTVGNRAADLASVLLPAAVADSPVRAPRSLIVILPTPPLF